MSGKITPSVTPPPPPGHHLVLFGINLWIPPTIVTLFMYNSYVVTTFCTYLKYNIYCLRQGIWHNYKIIGCDCVPDFVPVM